jgi:hypothetical protein
MFEWREDLTAGDPVVWWADKHGRGLPPAHPQARKHRGVIDHPHQAPGDPSTIVAYTVRRTSVAGPFLMTLSPNHGHRPRPPRRRRRSHRAH